MAETEDLKYLGLSPAVVSALKAEAKPVVHEPSKRTTLWDDINSVVRRINEGLTFGASKKLMPMLKGAVTGQPSAEIEAEERAQSAEFAERHPWIGGIAEAIGAAPTMLLGGGAVARLPLMAKGPGVWSKVGRVAERAGRVSALGAGAGAVAGYGESEPGNELEAASGGAMVGAVLGPAAALGGALGGRGVNKLYDLLRSKLGKVPLTKDTRKLAEALERDKMTAEDLERNLVELGPEATITDAGGRNVRALGEATAIVPGPGAQIAEKTLTERRLGRGARIKEDIEEATGTRTNLYREKEALDAERKAKAGPLYEKAMDFGPVYSTRIGEFLKDPVVNQGLKEGLKIQRLDALAEGKVFDPSDYAITRFNPAGDPIIEAVPNMRTLDTVKKGLDNIIEQYRDPVTGRLQLDGVGLGIDKVRRAFVKEIDTLNPDYAKAREAWAGPSASMEALNRGRDALKNDPEVTASIIAKLSDVDKPYFRMGVERAIKDMVDKTQDTADATRRIFGNPAIRDKIKAALGNNAAFTRFETRMKAEATLAETERKIQSQSATAHRQEAVADLGQDPNALAGIGMAGVDVFRNPLSPGAWINALRAAGEAARGGRPVPLSQGMAAALGPKMFAQGKQAGPWGLRADDPRSMPINQLRQRMILNAVQAHTKNKLTGAAAMGAGFTAGQGQGNW